MPIVSIGSLPLYTANTDGVKLLMRDAANAGTYLVTKEQLLSGIVGSGVTSFNTRTGPVTLAIGDISGLGAGILSSSAFSSPSQGTLRATINGQQTDVDLGLQTGDRVTFSDVTGSFTGSLTGTLIGTASWATVANTVATVTAGGVQGSVQYNASGVVTGGSNLILTTGNSPSLAISGSLSTPSTANLKFISNVPNTNIGAQISFFSGSVGEYAKISAAVNSNIGIIYFGTNFPGGLVSTINAEISQRGFSVYNGGVTASLQGTASYALNALTASSADNFVVKQNITGSNALFTGTITAQKLIVQTVTSSVVYSSGSNIFGSKMTDIQQMTGSVSVTGSVTVTGGNFVGNLNGNASTVTNGVYTTGDQTIGGNKTFSSTITGSISGNANSSTYSIYLGAPTDSIDAEDISTRKNSGFYQSNSPGAGWPAGASSWWHMHTTTHSNGANYYAMQLAASFFSQGLWYRSTNGSGTTAWSQVVLNTGTWGISITGNAGTATTWATARTLTIGSTGKSVNGSADVTWTLGEIGAAATNQTMHIGTTAVAINRGSATLSLTGVNIDGNAGTVTNGVYTTGDQTIGGTKTFSSTIAGSISGNADTVDGYHASTSTIANGIVVRDANGYIFGNYINLTDDGNPGSGTSISSFITKQGDNYYRSVSPTNAMVSIRGVASGTWGINITGNSATTSQTTFSRVRTDGINRGSYGAISISGATNGYSGIDFGDASTTLMVRTSDGLSGMYRTDNTWLWYFDGSGILQVGTVPVGRITGTLPVSNGGTGAVTFNTGRILYGNGTSAIGTSTNLYFDSVNNRLGIQTESPQSFIHINAGVTATTAAPTYRGRILLADGNGTTGQDGGLEFHSSTFSSGYGWRITAPDPGGGDTPLQFQYRTNSAAWSVGAQIKNDGEFWIMNGADQGAYNLQVGGTGVWGAGAYVNGSDSRIKENIQDLSSSLDVVNKLKPKTFKYKQTFSKDRSTQTGFIAQDLKEALADQPYLSGLVKEEGAYMSVAYQNIIPILVKAVQEQQAQIESLKLEIAALKAV